MYVLFQVSSSWMDRTGLTRYVILKLISLFCISRIISTDRCDKFAKFLNSIFKLINYSEEIHSKESTRFWIREKVNGRPGS